MGQTTTRQLIEDYLSITGRPVATLTVDEYIKFTTAQIAGHPANYSYISTPVIEKSVEITENGNNKYDSDQEMAISQPAQLKLINNEPKKEKSKPTKEEMLKFMKSVSG